MVGANCIRPFMIQINFPVYGTNHSQIYYRGIFAARGIIVKIDLGGVACL
jgi:hypothetical protein